MTNPVTVTTEIEFRRWVAPKFARVVHDPKQRGEGPAVATNHLSKGALDGLYGQTDYPAPRIVSSK